MSEIHKQSAIARWAKVPKEEKSARMSAIAKIRMSRLSKAERLEIGQKLTKSRYESK